jgi:hypothetical protein
LTELGEHGSIPGGSVDFFFATTSIQAVGPMRGPAQSYGW